MSNVADILHGRACRRCDHAQRPDEAGDRLLISRIEHPHLLQLCFQCQEPFIEEPRTLQRDLTGVELIPSVPLVDIHAPFYDHLIPVLHGKSQTLALPGKHDARNGPALIFQGKINMPGRMVFTVGHLPADTQVSQEKILGKHIFDICIYLFYRIDIAHGSSSPLWAERMTFPSNPLIKEADSSPPYFFAISTASLAATFSGTSGS